MPCSDGGPSLEQIEAQQSLYKKRQKEIALTRSVLCGICTALEAPGKPGLKGIDGLPKVLDKVDWEEVGFTRVEFAAWWNEHKLEDQQRRDREQAAKRKAETRKALQKSGLAKLTPAERKALGIE